MKSNKGNPGSTHALSEELRRHLSQLPGVRGDEAAEVASAVEALYDDPSEEADFLKSRFVNEMLSALHERGESRNKLADRWGKSRQYVHKLFNENHKINYSLETLCEVAHLLGRRVELHFPRKNEHTMVLHCMNSEYVPTPQGWEPKMTDIQSIHDGVDYASAA